MAVAPAVGGPCAPPAWRGGVAQTLGRRSSTRRIPAGAFGAGGTPSDGGTRVKCPRGNGPKRRVCANAGWCRGKHPAPPQPRPGAHRGPGVAIADGRGGQVCGTCDKRSVLGRPLESDQVRRTRRRQATDLAPKARPLRRVAERQTTTDHRRDRGQKRWKAHSGNESRGSVRAQRHVLCELREAVDDRAAER